MQSLCPMKVAKRALLYSSVAKYQTNHVHLNDAWGNGKLHAVAD